MAFNIVLHSLFYFYLFSRFLRREMTIRIHTSFFASLFFASLMRVFFTSLVVYQYLIKSGSRLLMEENKVINDFHYHQHFKPALLFISEWGELLYQLQLRSEFVFQLRQLISMLYQKIHTFTSLCDLFY